MKFWFGWGAVGALVEAWALRTKRQHWTLSHALRRTLRCHTRAGRCGAALGWVILGAWLIPHLADQKQFLEGLPRS